MPAGQLDLPETVHGKDTEYTFHAKSLQNKPYFFSPNYLPLHCQFLLVCVYVYTHILEPKPGEKSTRADGGHYSFSLPAWSMITSYSFID